MSGAIVALSGLQACPGADAARALAAPCLREGAVLCQAKGALSSDQLGSYTNSPDRANADYYLTADGERGRIVEAIRAGAPFCIFYAHWQGLNPATGVGWPVFQTVVKRLHTHLADRITWMRPSAYTDPLV